MLVCVVIAAFQALALEAFFAGQAREPVQQFVGGAVRFLFQQPGHQIRHRQCVFAALEHLLDRARCALGVALVGLVRLGETRRFRLEIRQGVHIGFDLAGTAEKRALRPGEHRHRRLRHRVQAFAANRRQRQRRATGHGIVSAGFFTQWQQQLAGVTQGQLGAGLHFEDARVSAQQHVVIHQVAEALLLGEHAQQHILHLAHALLERAVGVHQLDHRFDVLVPGGQHLRVTLAQRDLPVAGLGAVGHGSEGLFVVGEFFQHVPHAHVEQAQLAGQVVAITDVEGVLDITRQALKVAQVGFDFQAQAKPVLLAKIGEEVVDLCVELETVDVLGRAVQLLGGQLCAQFTQAQGALVEVFAQWLK
ncbi:hypothetical protein AO284_34430 [Pseudomonas sp. NZIPFR-PS2]|nr:hypothetical protein AO284_34430 [Pseudomonas sp. NZIPFR-PS2]